MDKVPVRGDTWRHTKTGLLYSIFGSVYNTVTDTVDVIYEPLYECEYRRFTRPIFGHPKAWTEPNEDGTPRFVKVT